MQTTWDVIVVGGGAAGLSAALMLGRARRRTLVVDAGSPRNRFAAHMHGVLGHDGLDPAELLARGRAEVARYGAEVVTDRVVEVTAVHHGLDVALADAGTLRARALVVATGITDALPDVPGLAERWGTRVLHCPYCHGWEVRDQRLGVLTTSPASLHQAQLVRQWSGRVTVFAAGLGELGEDARRRLVARGTTLVEAPVVAIEEDDDGALVVRTADGGEHRVDAVFTGGTPRPHDAFLAPLRLDRTSTPVGDVVAVAPDGRTSHPRVWAAGNVVDPTATVPVAMAAGSMAGARVNAALVEEDTDAALSSSPAWPTVAPAAFWEDRYAGAGPIWSGRPNAGLVPVVAGLEPGRALDLGCGEGADAIWLAAQGWDVTGIDISPTAIRRAREAAAAAGLDGDAPRFEVADLGSLDHDGEYDLVTASFLHSPVALARADVLRRAAAQVAPGGHLLVLSHAAPPPWAHDHDTRGHHFPTPQDELHALALPADAWTVVVAEVRTRETTTTPDGVPATLDDTVVLLRRR